MLNEEFLSPKSDVIFKLLFGDERGLEQLTDFLKSVLRLPAEDYEEVTIVDPHLLREGMDDKLGILDVKVKTKSQKIINVEIQLLTKPALRERVVFSLAKMVTGQIGAGDGYIKIKRAVSIFITNFILVPENEAYHNHYTLYDSETGSQFTDLLEVNVLELVKLPEIDDGTERWNWMKFLTARRREELEMLAQKSPQVGKAVVRLMELSQDERARMLYESRQMMEWDNLGLQMQARQDGWQEGRQEGRQEGMLAVAKNLLNDGEPINRIIRITGLTYEEVEGLRAPVN